MFAHEFERDMFICAAEGMLSDVEMQHLYQIY